MAKEWVTTYKAPTPVQDPDPVDQAGVQESYVDGSDVAPSSCVEQLRDKVDAVARYVGDSAAAPAGSLRSLPSFDIKTKTADQTISGGWTQIATLVHTFTVGSTSEIWELIARLILYHGSTLHSFGIGYSFDAGTNITPVYFTSTGRNDTAEISIPLTGLSAGAKSLTLWAAVDGSQTVIRGNLALGAPWNETFDSSSWVLRLK